MIAYVLINQSSVRYISYLSGKQAFQYKAQPSNEMGVGF